MNYLEMINDDDSKIIAAKDLATKFDFTKINRIGDIEAYHFLKHGREISLISNFILPIMIQKV